MQTKKIKTMKRILLVLLLTTIVITIASANIIRNVMLVNKITKCKVVSTNVKSTSVPFTIENGWIIIEVKVKGKNDKENSEKFILDTGAPTSITNEGAIRNGLEVEKITMKQVALGESKKSAESGMTKDPVIISIGDMSVQQAHLMVEDMNIQRLQCMNVNGIIGSNLLSKFIVSLDFENKTLTLTAKHNFDYSKMGTYSHALDFMPVLMQKNPYLSVTVDHTEFIGIFDTGFSGGILLNADSTSAVLKTIISHDSMSKYETYADLNNANGIVKKKGTAYQWNHAWFTGDTKDTFRNTMLTIYPSSDNSVNIGLQFISSHKKVIIDWNKNKIYFFDKATKTDTADKKIVVRLRHLSDEQKFVVGIINVASGFYKNGLQSGDDVISINNTKLADIKTGNECELLDEVDKLCKTAQTLTIRRGDQQLTIAN